MTSYQTIIFSVSCCAILILSSCKKDPIQYTFEGKISESVDNIGLQGANVQISQRVYDGNVASSLFSTAALATTGSDGTYKVSFNREKVVEFKFKISKTGYFTEEFLMSSSEVSTENSNVVNETLDAESWIKFDLTNFSGFPEDVFTMIYFNFREGCSGCTTNDYHYFNGTIDTIFTIKTTAGVYTRYNYKNPGAATYISDSVYTVPFDTVNVVINY